MDPDGVARFDDLHQLVAEQAVHLLVRGPGVLNERSADGEVMEQRPDRLIAEPQVVLIDLRLRKKNRNTTRAGQLFANSVPALNAEELTGHPRPSDPYSLERLRQRGQTGRQSAGTGGGVELAFPLGDADRKTVGRDDQSSHNAGPLIGCVPIAHPLRVDRFFPQSAAPI